MTMIREMATALLFITIGIGATACVGEPPSGSHAAGYQDDGHYYHEREYQRPYSPYDREYQRPYY
jgi:hypothetical protein